MQICMVISSHFPLKKQCLDLGCSDIMTTVLSLEFGYFFFFLLVINFSQSQYSSKSFFGMAPKKWWETLASDFCGAKPPNDQFWMG